MACMGLELNYSNTAQTSLTGRSRIGRAVGGLGMACMGLELNYSNTAQTSLTGRARIGRAVGALRKGAWACSGGRWA